MGERAPLFFSGENRRPIQPVNLYNIPLHGDSFHNVVLVISSGESGATIVRANSMSLD